ncbi:MAG: AraC family transcriptional regulator [Planctomycetia bacterium]|nr:AraC family transcriptional regulator [Planctomycetia bacterium]
MRRSMGSPYPHHSWLAYWISIKPPRAVQVYERSHDAHHLILVTGGQSRVTVQTECLTTNIEWTCGSLAYFPCHHRSHELTIRSIDGMMAYNVIIPRRHLSGNDRAVEVEPTHKGAPSVIAFRDTLLEVSVLRLITEGAGSQVSEEVGDDVAARSIVLRLCERAGDAAPKWCGGGAVFTPEVMRRVIATIDGHLRIPLSCEALADGVQLSPGHFARKFRCSAGLSLSRFINVRRVRASFALLQKKGDSLAGIALDLGFCSQSHFTRQFTGLTGMSPGHFRRLHAGVGD